MKKRRPGANVTGLTIEDRPVMRGRRFLSLFSFFIDIGHRVIACSGDAGAGNKIIKASPRLGSLLCQAFFFVLFGCVRGCRNFVFAQRS